MQRKAGIRFDTALAQKDAYNRKEFFGHLQWDSRLRTQITTLKDGNSEPPRLIKPRLSLIASETFTDRFLEG